MVIVNEISQSNARYKGFSFHCLRKSDKSANTDLIVFLHDANHPEQKIFNCHLIYYSNSIFSVTLKEESVSGRKF